MIRKFLENSPSSSSVGIVVLGTVSVENVDMAFVDK